MKIRNINIETAEKEGYRIRIEDGATYIERDEKREVNGSYGRTEGCFIFYQRKIELDKEQQEIIKEKEIVYYIDKDRKHEIESQSLFAVTRGNERREYSSAYYAESTCFDDLMSRGQLNNNKKITDLGDTKEIIEYNGRFNRYEKVVKRTIENDKEIICINNDINGELKNILRKTKNSNVEIEELYEKDQPFSTFKIDGIEIPLCSLNRYKKICEQYKIEPLKSVLEANEIIKPTIKSVIDFFKNK